MDINCRHCGEPWDASELHDFGDYHTRAALFAQHGCGAFDSEDPTLVSKCSNQVYDQQLADISAALQDDSDYPDEWIDADAYRRML